MSRLTAAGMLTMLPPGTTRAQARRKLGADQRHRAALDKEIERLRVLTVTEQGLWKTRGTIVCGTDEVGRGPLAGPLVAAAVAFRSEPFIPCLKDSKLLAARERELLVPWIESAAVAVAVSVVDVADICHGNLHHLSLLAMAQAVTSLGVEVHHVLVDGRHKLNLLGPMQRAIVGGDRSCAAIAAASIVAKVARDRMMDELGQRYPGYGLERHKGYATAEHLEALERLVPCPIHRTNFAPVRDRLAVAVQGELFGD